MDLLSPSHFRPVTSARMRELDARAMKLGLSAEVLMENAGRALAEGVLTFHPQRALVVCGGGNNGGDGLVAARWLMKAGVRVRVVFWKEPDLYRNECRAHWRALKSCRPHTARWRAGFRLEDRGEPVVDAFLGTGVRPPLTFSALGLIGWMNARRGIKIAADVPSGLDADRGLPLGDAVRAALTVTMGLPKKGLVLPSARSYVGRLRVGDLGFPPGLLGITRPVTDRKKIAPAL